jgi:Sigma-70 region 2
VGRPGQGIGGGTEASDGELLRACEREPEAFAHFYRRHVGAVLGYLHRRTGRADLAADICAETFARALERCDQYDRPAGLGGRGCSRSPARCWSTARGAGRSRRGLAAGWGCRRAS